MTHRDEGSSRPTPLHVAEQEVARLERMLSNRKARVAGAERKLDDAKERLRTARERSKERR